MDNSNSYNHIPMASAKPLPNTNSYKQNENDLFVVQAHVEENDLHVAGSHNYQNNEPTIAVSASDVVVQPPPKPSSQTPVGPSTATSCHNSQLQYTDPRIRAFKERRKRRQALAAATGFVAGTILVGPIIGFVAGAIVHGTVKSRGRAKQRRMEQQLVLQQQGGGRIYSY